VAVCEADVQTGTRVDGLAHLHNSTQRAGMSSPHWTQHVSPSICPHVEDGEPVDCWLSTVAHATYALCMLLLLLMLRLRLLGGGHRGDDVSRCRPIQPHRHQANQLGVKNTVCVHSEAPPMLPATEGVATRHSSCAHETLKTKKLRGRRRRTGMLALRCSGVAICAAALGTGVVVGEHGHGVYPGVGGLATPPGRLFVLVQMLAIAVSPRVGFRWVPVPTACLVAVQTGVPSSSKSLFQANCRTHRPIK
jgi:hypothetical protein